MSAVLAALALTAAAPAGAAADTPSPDADAAAELLGISKAEAADRLELQPHIGALRDDARRLWPDTFAGMWTDHAAGGAVTIAFTDDAEAKVAQLRQGFPRPLLLKAVTKPHPVADLDAVLDALADLREAVRAGRAALPGLTTPRFDLTVDEPGNRVVVRLERPTETLRAALRARYGDAVTLVAGEPRNPAACSISACRHSMRSGLRADNGAGSWCSTAFTTGQRNTFSAAHCSGGDRYHDGWRYGGVIAQQQSGRVDAELHSVGASGFTARAWQLDAGETAVRPITSRASYASTGIGDVVCKTGATSGRSCGTVKSVNDSPHWVSNSHSFILAGSMCSRGGDSGSGVYLNNQAIGILSGGSSDDNCSVAPNEMVFGHIEFAQSALNESVKLSESAPTFTGFRAVGGEYRVTVTFSMPVSCASVAPYDFRVRLATAVVLNVTGHTCVFDSDSSFELELSTPNISRDAMEVEIAGTITDPGGNRVPYKTVTGTVE